MAQSKQEQLGSRWSEVCYPDRRTHYSSYNAGVLHFDQIKIGDPSELYMIIVFNLFFKLGT